MLKFFLTKFLYNKNDSGFLTRYFRGSQRYRYPTLFLFIAVYLLFSGIPTVHAENKLRVLVLHSYHYGFEWTYQIMTGIRSVLNESNDVELLTEHMDTKFHKPEILFPHLLEIYKVKYHNLQPDIIISSDNNALNFLLSNRELLFPGVPVVFCGINNYSDALIKNRVNMTGVAETFDIEGTINLALHLHPETRKIAVVSDTTHTSLVNLERMKHSFPKFTDRVSFVELTGLAAQELKAALNRLPDDSLVIHNGLYRDRKGRNFTIGEGLDFVVQNTRAPVYTLWRFMIAQGVMGGMVVNGFSQGEQAALMTARILQGESPDHIPVLKASPNVPIFDDTAMSRFGINRSDLPENSIVLNIPHSFYNDHKQVFWVVIVSMATLISIIFVLVININTRKRVEDKLKKYQDHLEDLVKKRTVELEMDIVKRKKAEEGIKASLEEKEVLLKEIHHRVKNNMQVISSLLKLQAANIKDERITQALMDCQGRVRAMAFVHETLYSSDRLASIDFKVYVSRLVDKIYQSYRIKGQIKLTINAEDIALGIEQATPLGLIINELVSNSIKYAFPENRDGEISIGFQLIEQDMWELVFQDNGIGIPKDLDWRDTDSLGLQLVVLLAENQLDGTIDLNQDKGSRFTIKFRLKEIE